jgi:predicted dehydrogenase
LDWDLWLGPLRRRPYNPRYLHGVFRWLMESGGGQIRDRGAHQFSTILWCMNADHQVSYSVEAKGTPPTQGLWDCPVDMEVIYQFKNPDWTLLWGQPGDKVGKTEFGQVFWGEDRRKLILEWEGAYRGAEPEAVHFKLPPGGVEVPRTALYADFNMNHKADWFQAIRAGTRPAVDIEIAHRTATLCNLGNLAYLLGRKLVWDGQKQQVVGDDAANRLLGRPQRHPYHL